ncbi:hypothetical protein [Dongshaea marina]|uniref:hypothetical protein n=1 Tax=Dongshaea marina TaxID=2047966 RepID=UPI000D3E6C3E|nr:hypothetical protein [Dongshaea marina]
MTSSFKNHGEHEIRIIDQQVWCICEGQWNLEQTELFFEEFKEKVIPISHKPWVRVNDIRCFELAGVECGALLAELIRWGQEHQCLVSIYVINSKIHEMFAGMVKKLSEQMNAKFIFTEDIREAEQLASDFLNSPE